MNTTNRIKEQILELKPCDFRKKLLRIYLKDIRAYSRNSKAALLIKHVPGVKTNDSVSVSTQHCGSALNVVRKSIQALKMNEILDESQPADIVWVGLNLNTSLSLFDRYVNKFPDSSVLLSKLNLFRSLELQRSLLAELYGFYPPTWFVPFQNQALQLDCRKKHRTYIIKPSNGGQGKGIHLAQLTTNQDNLPSPAEIATCPKSVQSIFPLPSTNPHYQNLNHLEPAIDIVQRYETDPVLLNGYKTDLRVYVLIESLNPLKIHIYRDALVRLASCPYKKPNATNLNTQTMHLTNYSINKLVEPSDKYVRQLFRETESTDKSQTSITTTTTTTTTTTNQKNSNSYWKRSLHDLIKSPGSGRWFRADESKFWHQIDEIVRRTIFALCAHFKVAYWARFGCQAGSFDKDQDQMVSQGPRCFQILGFDFLLLEPDFRPILLEVNSNPSLRTDSVHLILPKLTRQIDQSQLSKISSRFIHKLPKRLSRALDPANPVAQAATILSSSMGDRYAEFEPSKVDEEIKGGLVQCTLFLIANRIRQLKAQKQQLEQQRLEQQKQKQQQRAQKREIRQQPEHQLRHTKSAPIMGSVESIQDTVLKRSNSDWQLFDLHIEHRSNNRLEKLSKRKRLKTGHPKSRTMTKQSAHRHKYENSDGSAKLVVSKHRIANQWNCVRNQVNVNSKMDPLVSVPELKYSRRNGIAAHLSARPGVPNSGSVNHGHANTLPQICETIKTIGKTDQKKIDEKKHKLTRNRPDSRTNLDSSAEHQLTDLLMDTEYSNNTNADVATRLQCIYDETAPTATKKLDCDYPEDIQWSPNFRKFRDHLRRLYNDKPKHHVNLSSIRALDSPMRITDTVADLFIYVLTPKRRRFEADEPTGQAFTARMDLSNFRSFCRLCRIDYLGVSFTELDLIYSKHRNWWNRVFEVETTKMELVKGISFPAFVDLCVQLANYLCTNRSTNRKKLSLQIPIIPLLPWPMKSAYKTPPTQSDLFSVDGRSSSSSLDESKEVRPIKNPSPTESLNRFYRFIQHCLTSILQI